MAFISFDLCAFVLIIVLLICFYYKKYIPNTQNKTFLTLLWFTFSTTLFDILDVTATSFGPMFPLWFHQFTSYAFFITLNAIPPIYTYYIIVLTNTQKKYLKSMKAITLLLPIFISFFVIATNPFTNFIFYYDGNMAYFRGPGQSFLYLVSFYYLIFGILYINRYKEIIPSNKRIALYSFVFLATIPLLIQFFIPSLMISIFAVTICLLLIYMTIQNPEEILDYSTGLFNRSSYITQASINFGSEIAFTTISIRINDYSYFRRVFGITQMTAIAKDIAMALEHIPLKNKRIYYMNDGHFNFTVNQEDMYDKLPYELSKLFEHPFGVENMELNLTAQLCVINIPKDAHSIELLMDYVDFTINPLLQGNIVLFTNQVSVNDKNRTDKIIRAVQNALKKDLFEVYYQPIYSAKQNTYHSAEALVRLNDPELGPISPAEFIPITEKNGDIIQIGMVVFRKVCSFISKQNLKSLGIDYIEVNLSVAQCMQKKLAEDILKEMAFYELPTKCINLEITETAAAYSPETLAENMKNLALSGIKFSLDDYGTGFSSMSCMVELPFDFVKLDQGLIASMGNEKALIAMNSTVAMLRQLDMKIVAEGVETMEQAMLLEEMGCDYLQGYYFSRPIPETEFLAFLNQKNKNNYS